MARKKVVDTEPLATTTTTTTTTKTVSRQTSPDPDRPFGPLSVIVPPHSRFEVKVNNANTTELKIALDDALKKYLTHPSLFIQNHQHTDVRLVLGWASVFVAAATGLYGYKVEFEKAKPALWIGVGLYMLLSTIQTLYAYFIESDVVFVGKRRTSAKRIVNERIKISSSSVSPTAPSSSLFSSTRFSPSASASPSYALSLSYLRSTNGGKSLLAKGKATVKSEYSRFFDEEGVLRAEEFERWVGEGVEAVMEGKNA